jgi:hypothetical protein
MHYFICKQLHEESVAPLNALHSRVDALAARITELSLRFCFVIDLLLAHLYK